MTIKEVIDRLTKMKTSVTNIAKEEFTKEAALFSDLNRAQLNSGTDALGNDMPTYSASNKKTGKLDLFLSGDYHQGIKPLFESDGIDMISTDSKFAFLDPKYNTALGINENSQNILIEKVTPNVIKRLKAL